MTRKKVKLAFIVNDSARKATYKKRKKGLIKKVEELSTLCGVDACAIIYGPYDNQPEVWPPTPLEAQRVLARFRNMPEMDQSKKMVNQESFLVQRVDKVGEQLVKLQRENREKEISYVMYQALVGKGIDHLGVVDLTDLGWVIDQNLKDVKNRIDVLKNGASSSRFAAGPSSSNAGAPRSGGLLLNALYEEKPPAPVAPTYDPNAESSTHRQWLTDLMNANDRMGGQQLGGGDVSMPFADSTNMGNNGGPRSSNNNNGAGLWSNAFFPWDK